jgi:hypothetical protein
VTKAWADCGVGGDGGSDLIGWRSVVVTEDMVGKTIAQLMVIETKTNTGRIREEQKAFISTTKNAGAIAGIARSEEDLEKIIAEW